METFCLISSVMVLWQKRLKIIAKMCDQFVLTAHFLKQYLLGAQKW